MSRKLTKDEEQVIRLVHHEFRGLAPKQAAERMGVPVRKIYTYLASVKRKAPRLFPILTAEQFKVYKLLIDEGMGYEGVAKVLGCNLVRVSTIVDQLHKKGFSTVRPRVRRYSDYMDSQVTEKF